MPGVPSAWNGFGTPDGTLKQKRVSKLSAGVPAFQEKYIRGFFKNEVWRKLSKYMRVTCIN